MLKSFINRSLRRVFDDIFVDLDHDGGSGFRFDLNFLSGGRSNLTLTDQQLRPDLFDVLLQPLRLVHGSIALISIDGLAELSSSVAWNVPIKVEVRNVNLVFRVDSAADAERVQILSKLLVELQTGQGPCSPQGQLLIGELLAKLLRTKAPLKDPDHKKRRALLLRGLALLFRHTELLVKGVHIRLETEAEAVTEVEGAASTVGALGLSLASMRMRPGTESQRPPLCSSDAMLLACQFKSMHVYVDYGRGPYSPQAFSRKELHVGLVMPVDVHVVASAEVLRRGAFVVPSMTITVPTTVLACDPRQAEVLAQLHESFCRATRRFSSLRRVSSLWGPGTVPRSAPYTGLHLLPSLAYQNRTFPTQISVPAPGSSGGLASFFKRRLQGKATLPSSSSSSSSSSRPWARAMWRHAIRFVLSEVRRAVPLGRWKEVARFAYFRRQYAFLYSRLLRRGYPEGHRPDSSAGISTDAPLPHAPPFFEDAEVAVPGSIVSRLNLMEMALPLSSILQFRLVAVLVAHVEERHAFLARSRKPDETKGPVVVWGDILRMQLALLKVGESKSLWRSILGRAEEDEEEEEEEGKHDVPLSQLLGRLVENETPGTAPSSSSSSSSSSTPSGRPLSAISTNLDLTLHPELAASKPSAATTAKVFEAAQWAHERHASPVKLLLPCISVVLANVEAHLRQPVSDGKRTTIATLSLLRCGLSLLVSQSEGDGLGTGAGALLCLRAEAQQVLVSAAVGGGSALQPLALSLPSSGPNALSLCLVVDVAETVATDLSLHLPDMRCPLDPASLALLSSEPVRDALRRCITAGRRVLGVGAALSAPLDDATSPPPPPPPPLPPARQKGEFARYAFWLAHIGPLIRQRVTTASVHVGRAEVELPSLLVSAVARERAKELAARAREVCGWEDEDLAVGEADGEDVAVLRGLSRHIRSATGSPLRAILRVVLDSKLWGAAGPTEFATPIVGAQMRISVPAVDLLVSKRPLPGAEGRKVELDFRLAGLELTLPVSEAALAQAVAVFLHALVR